MLVANGAGSIAIGPKSKWIRPLELEQIRKQLQCLRDLCIGHVPVLGMDFDNVFVLDDVVSLDGGPGVHVSSPNSRKLKVLRQITVDEFGHVEQCAAAAKGERPLVVRVLVGRLFRINANNVHGVIDRSPEFLQPLAVLS